MKYFISFLIWFVFVGFGYYFNEWTGFLVAFILFALLYTAFTDGLREAINYFINTCIGIFLISIVGLISTLFSSLYQKVPFWIVYMTGVFTSVRIFDLISLKRRSSKVNEKGEIVN